MFETNGLVVSNVPPVPMLPGHTPIWEPPDAGFPKNPQNETPVHVLPYVPVVVFLAQKVIVYKAPVTKGEEINCPIASEALELP